MSTVTITANCCCGSIGRVDLRQCPEHHRIYRGDVRLTSVGRIVSASFPLDPAIPPAVLENARDRGEQIDKLFAAYVRGELTAIPAGTRHDARDLFFKLQKWYDLQRFSRSGVQVLLGGEDHGGIVDFILDGVPFDLKSTYSVLDSHRLQVAGYSTLLSPVNRSEAYILHVTERFTLPRLVPIIAADYNDWDISLEHFRMKQRRTKGKALDESEEKED